MKNRVLVLGACCKSRTPTLWGSNFNLKSVVFSISSWLSWSIQSQQNKLYSIIGYCSQVNTRIKAKEQSMTNFCTESCQKPGNLLLYSDVANFTECLKVLQKVCYHARILFKFGVVHPGVLLFYASYMHPILVANL